MHLRLAQCEGELTWLVYIISMILGSCVPSKFEYESLVLFQRFVVTRCSWRCSHVAPNSNSESQQLIDGDLTTAVLQLLQLTDAPQYASPN